ncbi:TerC family protein [Phenylobacterium sp.]|jgi:YjbE family integral membrane protein|uniref:TerC family protein n=1 Tax=Phenylobacterium sp. TaxID=1871053 RepID=UPI002F94D6F7
MFEELFSPGALSALLQVLMIDLVLAGDNAVAVGLAAGGLPQEQRKKAILYGLIAAVVMRIGFALITTQLLGIVGLLFAGGLLLLWVCWKMWRELHHQAEPEEAAAEAVLDADPTTEPQAAVAKRAPKTFKDAFLQILIADVSMSLDNVLAVAGAAREHPGILVFGLLLSIALMGVAATWIAKLLHKYRWIGYVGLLIVLYVALHMMWEGHRTVVVDLGRTPAYNAAVPDFMDIGPAEEARHRAH